MADVVRKEDRQTLCCKECNNHFPVDMFVKKGRNKSSGAMQFSSRCKPCYRKHVRSQPSYNVEAAYRTEKREIVNGIKRQCVVCGYDRCKKALDFHHVTDDKEDGIAAMVMSKEHTIDELMLELKKCVVLCSNCHREHHDGLIDVTDYPRAVHSLTI